MSIVLRQLKRLLIFFLLLICILLLIVAWLLGSQSGLRLAVKQAQPFVPGELQIGAINGRVWGGFEIQDLHYRRPDSGLETAVARLRFFWRPTALFSKTVHIAELSATTVKVKLPPAAEEPPPPEEEEAPSGPPEIQIPDIELPVKVQVDAVRLEDFELQQGEGEPFVIHEALLAVSADKQVELQQLKVDAPLFKVSAHGHSALQGDHATALEADWQATLADLPALAGKATVNGTPAEMTLTHQLRQPLVSQLHATVYDLTGTLTWDVDLDWQDARWPLAADQALLVASEQGKVQAQGGLDNYQLHVEVAVGGAQIPAGSWNVRGHGDLERFTLETLHGEVLTGTLDGEAQVAWKPDIQAQAELHTKGLNLQSLWPDWPATLSLGNTVQVTFKDNVLKVSQLAVTLPETATEISGSAQVDLNGAAPDIQADLQWAGLRWPLAGETVMAGAEQGSLSFRGTPQAYQVQLHTALGGAQVPASQWQLEATGSDKDVRLAGLRGKLLGGFLNLSGEAAWQPQVNWNLALTGENLNPGIYQADWPGKLGLELHTQGKLAAQPEIQVDITGVEGKLRGYPVQIKGAAQGKGSEWTVRDFLARSGSAKIQAHGVVGELLDMKWQIDAPKLAELMPGLQGNLQAAGTARGKMAQPVVKLDLDGRGLGFEAIRLARVKADVTADLQQDMRFDADIQAAGLQQGEQTLLEDFNLKLSGPLSAHQLDVAVAAPQGRVDVQLRGGADLDTQRWDGDLSRLELLLPDGQGVRLAQPASLALSAQAQQLGAACLQHLNSPAKLCLNAEHNAGAVRAALKLQEVALALANPYLPDDSMQVSGGLAGEVNANLSAKGAVTADALFTLTPGQFQALIDDQNRVFAFEGGNIRATVTPQAGLDAKLDLKLLEHTAIAGHARLPGLTQVPLAGEQPLDAQLKLNFADFDLLAAFVPMLKKPTGTIEVAVSAGGSLDAPALQEAALHLKAGMEVPDLGLKLEDIRFDADTRDAKQINLSGGLKSGPGALQLDGKVLLEKGWDVYVGLSGKDFQVMDTPDVRARISPGIAVRVNPEELNVRGILTVPHARITPAISVSEKGTSAPDAVAVSSDVVIVEPGTEEDKKAPAMRTDIMMKLVLADDIEISVEGFESRIRGDLQVMLHPPLTMPLGNGEVEVLDGTFRAYGQDLEIERGLVLYADNPLDNPGLNIRALRKIYNDTSTNQVSEAGLNIRGTAKNPQLTLFSDPMVEDAQILSYILTGSPLNTSDPSKRALSVGSYLTKKLYAGVGINLFDGSPLFNLRYDINSRWGVQTSFGSNDDGIDFVYTLGR